MKPLFTISRIHACICARIPQIPFPQKKHSMELEREESEKRSAECSFFYDAHLISHSFLCRRKKNERLQCTLLLFLTSERERGINCIKRCKRNEKNFIHCDDPFLPSALAMRKEKFFSSTSSSYSAAPVRFYCFTSERERDLSSCTCY
jgi:hypothetical protein